MRGLQLPPSYIGVHTVVGPTSQRGAVNNRHYFQVDAR